MIDALVRGLVGAEPIVEVLGTGVTSRLYRVRWPGERQTVVKVFDAARGADFCRVAVDLEVAALGSVSEVDLDGLRFVRPLRSWPDHGAYEMEHVDGRPLIDAMASGAVDRAHVARRLVIGLQEFTRCARRPFGDLHLDNVLVEPDGKLVLLDPIDAATVRRVVAGTADPPWDPDVAHATDLVTLVVIEALRSPRRLRLSLPGGLAAARLVRAFAAMAARTPAVAGPAAYRRSARARLRAHAVGQGWRGRLKLAYRRPSLEVLLLPTHRPGHRPAASPGSPTG